MSKACIEKVYKRRGGRSVKYFSDGGLVRSRGGWLKLKGAKRQQNGKAFCFEDGIMNNLLF